MIAYQRYNALMMLMAGMKHGELTQGAPIGGMAAVMMYQPSDVYGRSRYNPVAMRGDRGGQAARAVAGVDVCARGRQLLRAAQVTLEDILAGRIKGKLYDAYRQSWVASPEPTYVAAGNRPLQAPLTELQAMLDAPRETVDANGKAVPTVAQRPVRVGAGAAGITRPAERGRARSLPASSPRPRWTRRRSYSAPELWDAIYGVPKGDITIEHIQHAFYMAANYGFQILNGNFAAAIDDYELKQRFMNDLATYRIDVSWLWTLVRHQAVITKDGYFQRSALTEDGVVLAPSAEKVKAGTRFTPELFQKVWEYHNEWTAEFFAELDRRGDPGRFDRGKAPIIMELLQRQLLSPKYIQHSARVLFVMAQAGDEEREQILEAIFDLSREELVQAGQAGTMSPAPWPRTIMSTTFCQWERSGSRRRSELLSHVLTRRSH